METRQALPPLEGLSIRTDAAAVTASAPPAGVAPVPAHGGTVAGSLSAAGVGAVELSEDQIDDLLFDARVGELTDFRDTLLRVVSEVAFPLAPKPQSSGPATGAAAREDGSVVVTQGDPAIVEAGKITSVLRSCRNESGNGPLHYIAANGHLGLLTYLQPFLTPELLIAQNASGNTPLHWASLNGHLTFIKHLISVFETHDQPLYDAQGVAIGRGSGQPLPTSPSILPASLAVSPSTDAAPPRLPHSTRDLDERAREKDLEDEQLGRKATGTVWDIKNNAGHGPISEAELNGKEDVVIFLLGKLKLRGEEGEERGQAEKEVEKTAEKEVASAPSNATTTTQGTAAR